MGSTLIGADELKEAFRLETERLGLKTHGERLEHAIREYVDESGAIRVRKLDWGVLAALANIEEGVSNAVNRKNEFKFNVPVSPVAEVLLAICYVCREKAKIVDKEEERRQTARKLMLRGGIGDTPAPRPAPAAPTATVPAPPAKPAPPDPRIGQYDKLRAAVVKAGFSVMETSGDWSIHDVSDRAKREAAEDLTRANQITDLQVANDTMAQNITALEAELAGPAEPIPDQTFLNQIPAEARAAVSLIRRIKQIAAECGDGFFEIIEMLEEGEAT